MQKDRSTKKVDVSNGQIDERSKTKEIRSTRDVYLLFIGAGAEGIEQKKKKNETMMIFCLSQMLINRHAQKKHSDILALCAASANKRR